MKHRCALWLAVFALVFLFACSLNKQNQETGIAGNVIHSESEEWDKKGMAHSCLDSEMSGKLIVYANGISYQTSFTYAVSEGNVQIDFGREPVRRFPYKLDGDTLMLKQGNYEAIYVRIK